MMIKICGGFGIFDGISGISSGSFVRWDFGKKRTEVEALEMLVAPKPPGSPRQSHCPC